MSPSPAARDSYNTSPSTLAGTNAPTPPPSGDGPAPGTESPGGDEGLKAVVQKVREMQTTLTDLAKQYPSAARSARMASTSLRAVLRDIVANPGAPEPTAPAMGG